ncbi:MAG: type II toxin-antitoxin system RelB/DinJ family antitoxin [Kiritimatiellae bacterium]|nr:type II toxin-antitoxin system RelB/DinJ family antitoxin [Kiritimatiellia bacterium]
MNNLKERTFRIDGELARRATRKLHRYGMTLDDALAKTLTYIVTVRGNPFAQTTSSEEPGALLLGSFREAEMMENGMLPKQNFTSIEELFADCRS